MSGESPRDRLVLAAADLFHRHGYHAVGVNELCQAADVRKGSFYYYFESKHALAHAALDHQRRMMVSKILEPAFSNDVSPKDRLLRYFDTLAEINHESMVDQPTLPGCPFGNMSAEVGVDEELIEMAVNEGFDAIRQHFLSCLEDAVTDGAEIDTETGADALLAYMEGALLVARSRRDPECLRTFGQSAPAVVGL